MPKCKCCAGTGTVPEPKAAPLGWFFERVNSWRHNLPSGMHIEHIRHLAEGCNPSVKDLVLIAAQCKTLAEKLSSSYTPSYRKDSE